MHLVALPAALSRRPAAIRWMHLGAWINGRPASCHAPRFGLPDGRPGQVPYLIFRNARPGLENGKIKGDATFEVSMVPSKLRFCAAMARADYGRSGTPAVGCVVDRPARADRSCRHHSAVELPRGVDDSLARAGLSRWSDGSDQDAGLLSTCPNLMVSTMRSIAEKGASLGFRFTRHGATR
jgi:hypothetical protein